MWWMKWALYKESRSFRTRAENSESAFPFERHLTSVCSTSVVYSLFIHSTTKSLRESCFRRPGLLFLHLTTVHFRGIVTSHQPQVLIDWACGNQIFGKSYHACHLSVSLLWPPPVRTSTHTNWLCVQHVGANDITHFITYSRHVQLQTGCDLLFSVKTASDLPPPPIVVPRFKQKYW
jgi:hypothetical protein